MCIRRTGCNWKTWSNIGRWTKALLDESKEYPEDMRDEKRKEQLKRICVVNIKKEGGGSRAKGSQLLAAVETYSDLILRQIEMYEPHVIVCCGLPANNTLSTARYLKDFVFEKTGDWKEIKSFNF